MSFGFSDRLHLRAVGQQRKILSGLRRHMLPHLRGHNPPLSESKRLQAVLLNLSLHWRSLSVLHSHSFRRAGFREASWVELDVALGQTGNLFLELLF